MKQNSRGRLGRAINESKATIGEEHSRGHVAWFALQTGAVPRTKARWTLILQTVF